MANHRQALKRHKQSLTRNLRNRHYKATVKTAVKKLRTAIQEERPSEEIEALYRDAASMLHRVAQKGVMKANTADRRVARLSKAVTAGPVELVKKRKKKKK